MPWTSDFIVSHTSTPPSVQLRDSLISSADSEETSASKITAAFAAVVNKAIEDDTFDILNRRHSEPYLLPGARFKDCRLERFAHALFGIVARGAHLTAYTYVKSSQGRPELKIWVARRSHKLYTFPGKLDTTVAGGIKAYDTPLACIIAECQEEASFPEELVRESIKHTGVLTYVTQHSSSPPLGLTGERAKGPGREKNLFSPETLYVFDLELPPDMVPKPCDDEVHGFELMSIGEVKTAMFGEEFKTNSAVVMIDFFVRHGILNPSGETKAGGEGEEDYVEIVSRMHRRLPVATGPSWKE
jgi:8-oxo-dGTP pyrophosphatase MutT (NUDIX family)